MIGFIQSTTHAAIAGAGVVAASKTSFLAAASHTMIATFALAAFVQKFAAENLEIATKRFACLCKKTEEVPSRDAQSRDAALTRPPETEDDNQPTKPQENSLAKSDVDVAEKSRVYKVPGDLLERELTSVGKTAVFVTSLALAALTLVIAGKMQMVSSMTTMSVLYATGALAAGRLTLENLAPRIPLVGPRIAEYV